MSAAATAAAADDEPDVDGEENGRGGEEQQVEEAGQAGVARAVGKVARQSAWQTKAGHHAGLPQEECVPVDKTCQQPRPPSLSSTSSSSFPACVAPSF